MKSVSSAILVSAQESKPK